MMANNMLTGKQFKVTHPPNFYKLIHPELKDIVGSITIHNYRPEYRCTDYVNAIYFGDVTNILSSYRLKFFKYLRHVIIPDDARISCINDYSTYYTDKCIIGDLIPLEVFINDNINQITRTNKHILKYVDNQTEQICLNFVQANGLAIKYVKNKTNQLCMEAVKQCGLALKYIDADKQTETMCMAALADHGPHVCSSEKIMDFVANQTMGVCLFAIKVWPKYINFIHNQPEELCLEAIKNVHEDVAMWHCIKQKTYNICKELVRQHGILLGYVKQYHYDFLTPELCAIALDSATQSRIYGVRHVIGDICFEKSDVDLILKYMVHQTDEICLKIVRHNGNALRFVRHQTPEICRVAINQTKKAQKYVTIKY
jgi:hypothetical protein